MILKKSCVPQLFLKGWITKVRRKKKVGEKVGLTVPHNQPQPQTFFLLAFVEVNPHQTHLNQF